MCRLGHDKSSFNIAHADGCGRIGGDVHSVMGDEVGLGRDVHVQVKECQKRRRVECSRGLYLPCLCVDEQQIHGLTTRKQRQDAENRSSQTSAASRNFTIGPVQHQKMQLEAERALSVVHLSLFMTAPKKVIASISYCSHHILLNPPVHTRTSMPTNVTPHHRGFHENITHPGHITRRISAKAMHGASPPS